MAAANLSCRWTRSSTASPKIRRRRNIWWVYALLLSSMIPSLINLAIGGMAFTSGIPGLPSLLLTFMPAAKAVPGFDRAWMALVLTGQMFAGAFLGIAAQ